MGEQNRDGHFDQPGLTVCNGGRGFDTLIPFHGGFRFAAPSRRMTVGNSVWSAGSTNTPQQTARFYSDCQFKQN